MNIPHLDVTSIISGLSVDSTQLNVVKQEVSFLLSTSHTIIYNCPLLNYYQAHSEFNTSGSRVAEERGHGTISMKTYYEYFKAGGEYLFTTVVFGLIVLSEVPLINIVKIISN